MTVQTFIIRDKTSRDAAIAAVSTIAGKPAMEVTIRPYRGKRSSDANRFYWGYVVNPMARETGYSPAEMHEEILGAYAGWEMREVRGHVREFPRRTSTTPATMEKMDFAGLIETGQRIAAELGIRLPDQEQYT